MDAQKFFNRGVDRIHNKDFQGAIEDFTATITLTSGIERKTITETHPDNSTRQIDIIETSEGRGNVYFNRGLAYMAIGKFNEAVHDFSKEIEYSPNDAQFYFNRAIANYCIGDDNAASEDLLSANKLDSKYTKELFLSQFQQ